MEGERRYLVTNALIINCRRLGREPASASFLYLSYCSKYEGILLNVYHPPLAEGGSRQCGRYSA